VVPSNTDPNVIEAIGRQFEAKAGVMSVVFAKDTVESVMKVTRLLQIGILGAAVVLLVAAGLLILNTIRTAMFARRREIEVMKLVGATNWFIRVPFMLEGLIQGLLGAAGACVAVVVLNNLVESRVTEGQSLAILQNFSVSTAEVNGTLFFLLLVGVLVGTIGSGVAVSRFLDV
jgi:cell division transport system permease protein